LDSEQHNYKESQSHEEDQIVELKRNPLARTRTGNIFTLV
jgi:hypothetical protein